ncbi:M18 family aminopeptidase [Oceanispirochaeta sp.]|jgi:aspartyl aminopeptidase|uniref:M18 family aminopeptidase n=1 Tax=Oceanispirochaeta sp. TaxID=2035350 RepID=UPI00260C612E|nr:M18 family aminopeptidase [Oceanispirochaeta sp.]MDA3957953.1 M18 family aminopeptidase [Oceanispirochaeta sp.]
MDQGIRSLLDYLNSAPTAYHAVSETEKKLKAAGYSILDESVTWNLKPCSGYYVIRNGSSLIAFHTGVNLETPGCFRIVTAHTDSPTFRLKEGMLNEKNGMLTLGVEVMGGPIFSTWLDRDLAVAGRILIRKKDGIETVLYKNSERKVLIPNPPIHLNRTVNKGFEYNAQNHLKCIVKSIQKSSDSTGKSKNSKENIESFYDLIASDLKISSRDILDADLILYDTQEAALTSWEDEFFSSGRIDNLAMCHASIQALLAVQNQTGITVAALFDNEETGSKTPQGADSSFLEQVLERIILSRGGSREGFMAVCASSFIVSADAAHAIHPNFSDLYDEDFTPELNKGPAIKKNAGWNYASTGETASLFKLICEKADVPYQLFINRSDSPTGKTLGPLSAARLGIPAVDVGNPLWSMHSIRETGGVKDHNFMIKAFETHYRVN